MATRPVFSKSILRRRLNRGNARDPMPRQMSFPFRLTLDIAGYRFEWNFVYDRPAASVPMSKAEPEITDIDHERDPSVRFCAECGSEMVGRVEPGGFNPQTGDPILVAFVVCPNWTMPSGSVVRPGWEGYRINCS